MSTRDIRDMISTATIGDGDQVLNILEKVCDRVDESERSARAVRLAAGSLIDIMIEVAEVAGGDEAWKDLTREILEKHKSELGFRD